MANVACPHCGHQITPEEMDAARFDANVAASSGCWEWTAARQPAGYGAFGAQSRNYGAHRWQWERHNGPIPNGMMVMHRCDNPACVRPEHLFLGTQTDNMRDKMAKGRHRYHVFQGEDHGRAKVTNEDVQAIRRLYAEGISGPELSRRYGLGRTAIYKIIRRQSWRHLD